MRPAGTCFMRLTLLSCCSLLLTCLLAACHGVGPGARFGFGCLISLLMPAPRSGCLDLGKSVVTSLRMSRTWKECLHLTPDVSILERVLVTGPVA